MCNCSGGVANIRSTKKDIVPIRIARPPKNISIGNTKKEVDKYRA